MILKKETVFGMKNVYVSLNLNLIVSPPDQKDDCSLLSAGYYLCYILSMEKCKEEANLCVAEIPRENKYYEFMP